MIAKLIERRRKRRVVTSYVKILPPLLKQRYGKRRNYTKGQVITTVKSAKLSERYIDFALSMYVSHETYERMMKLSEVSQDRREARKEIADEHFDGHYDFTVQDAQDVVDAASGYYGGHGDSDGGLGSSQQYWHH